MPFLRSFCDKILDLATFWATKINESGYFVSRATYFYVKLKKKLKLKKLFNSIAATQKAVH